MMQNTLLTSITPLQNLDEINCWDNRPFADVWPESKFNKPNQIKRTIKKKPKRVRTAYTTEQLKALEIIFTQSKYITPDRRQEIAKLLNISDKSIKIWFQNRRMKEKRESSESSDSSNETSVGEMSPPLVLTRELQNTEDTQSLMANFCAPDAQQYQVPNFYLSYRNEEQIQTSHVPDTVTANGMQFYTDTNTYPTQYYPCNENNYCNNYNYYQYQHENGMYNNYWASNNESNYFYN